MVSPSIWSVSPALSILAADQDNRQFVGVYKDHGFVASKTRKCESCIDVKPTSFTEGDEKQWSRSTLVVPLIAVDHCGWSIVSSS